MHTQTYVYVCLSMHIGKYKRGVRTYIEINASTPHPSIFLRLNINVCHKT